MAYDETLAERIREVISLREAVTEKKMFGGVCWMVGGNMACGIIGDELMVRLGPEEAGKALAEPHTRVMDFTGRPLRGFVVVEVPAIATDNGLAGWVDAGADFAASLPAK